LPTSSTDQFTGRTINPNGPLATGSQTGEPDEIENYFRDRRWPDLINYFQRWDPSLSSTAFLTDSGLVLTLPAFLVATIIWQETLDVGVLISLLLTPERKECPDSEDIGTYPYSGLSKQDLAAITEQKNQKFIAVHNTLTPRQRLVVGRTLKYLVEQEASRGDPQPFHNYAGLNNVEILAAIERLWGPQLER